MDAPKSLRDLATLESYPGLSVRYLGMSLGYALALGFCAAFGTLIPPLFRGELQRFVPAGEYPLLHFRIRKLQQ